MEPGWAWCQGSEANTFLWENLSRKAYLCNDKTFTSMNSEGSWFLTAKVSFPPIETLSQNSPSTTSWTNLHQAFLRSHACSISMLVHSARRGRCWVTLTWKLCTPFTAETTNIPCWETTLFKYYKSAKRLLLGGRTRRARCPRTSRHLPRRWGGRSKRSPARCKRLAGSRGSPNHQASLTAQRKGSPFWKVHSVFDPCLFVNALLGGLGHLKKATRLLWEWFKTSPSEIESMHLMITWRNTFHWLPRTGSLASCFPRCNNIGKGDVKTVTQGSAKGSSVNLLWPIFF